MNVIGIGIEEDGTRIQIHKRNITQIVIQKLPNKQTNVIVTIDENGKQKSFREDMIEELTLAHFDNSTLQDIEEAQEEFNKQAKGPSWMQRKEP